jgi:hypothetical protein
MRNDFHQWTEYFRQNANHFDHIDWKCEEQITDNERVILWNALRQFQHGEYSEGKNLMKYAHALGDEEYLNAIKYFIREEQNHAIILAQFMSKNDIPRLRGYWVDQVLRGLRNLASLENSITVLVTAEFIAAVFYQAIRNVTNSTILTQICDQILSDEEDHLAFQAFTLSRFCEGRNRAFNFVKRQAHRVLTAGTILVVWFGHEKMLIQGGFTFGQFWNAVFQEFDKTYQAVKAHSTPRLVIR